VPEGSARAGGFHGARELTAGDRVTGKVERHEPFGVFVYLAPGRVALMPTSETGVEKDADVAKAFPVGSEIEVIVLESDPQGRRLRVSRKAVQQAQEADELREYSARADAAQPQAMGTLADKLRGALGPKRR
jgi:small subunit ribosomal protein S1